MIYAATWPLQGDAHRQLLSLPVGLRDGLRNRTVVGGHCLARFFRALGRFWGGGHWRRNIDWPVCIRVKILPRIHCRILSSLRAGHPASPAPQPEKPRASGQPANPQCWPCAGAGPNAISASSGEEETRHRAFAAGGCPASPSHQGCTPETTPHGQPRRVAAGRHTSRGHALRARLVPQPSSYWDRWRTAARPASMAAHWFGKSRWLPTCSPLSKSTPRGTSSRKGTDPWD